MKKWLFVIMFSSTLVGCATPYQEFGFRGGVTGIRLDDNIFEVTSRGNGFTRTDSVYQHNLRKAAEMSLAAGCSYFVALDNRSQNFNAVAIGPSPNGEKSAKVNEGLNVVGGEMIYMVNGAVYKVIKPKIRENTYACFNKKPTALVPGLIFNAKYTLEDISKLE